ncbi:MAG: prepilin-type N-terminal cleavage/methylation domain-containing protein [Dysgonamonadaceae bacterium]
MRKRHNWGFTLLELIVVLAILGIISSIVIPSIVFITRRNTLKTVTQEIAQKIKDTQQLATNYRKEVIFDLDINRNTYTVRENRAKPKTFTTGQFSKDITITSNLYRPYTGDMRGVRRIKYSANGLPSQTGTIWITDQSGKTMTITIAVGTGRVKVTQ